MPRLRPDDFLDPRQYDGINAGFYRADPADYFRMRVYMLLLAMGRADEVGDLLNDGIEWRELKFRTMPSDDATPEDESKRRWEAAGIADAEVVYHHAAECLLRLVTAHVGLPPCPRLEIARMRTPGQFKRQVQSNLVECDLERLSTDLWPVFFGSEEVIEHLDPRPPAAEVAEARVAAARWVQHFAWTWLDRAPIYNTAKHGFALGAGEGGFSIGPMGPTALKLERFDPVITYIDEVGEKGDRRWAEHMTFVEPDKSVASALIATQMIEQLWLIAHHRYVGTPRPGKLHLFRDDLPKLDQDRAKRLGPYQMQGMVSQLLYLPGRPDNSSSQSIIPPPGS